MKEINLNMNKIKNVINKYISKKPEPKIDLQKQLPDEFIPSSASNFDPDIEAHKWVKNEEGQTFIEETRAALRKKLQQEEDT